MTHTNVTEIEGVKLAWGIYSKNLRGYFIKFNHDDLLHEKLNSVAVSINPKVGTIRGIDFQIEPFAEQKIVSCIQGSTFEVIIDIRPSSKSFGKIITFELSRKDAKQVYLPDCVAHRFQTLMPETSVQYFLMSQYSPEYSYSIDSFGDLGINCPLKELSISDKGTRTVSLTYEAQKYAESLNG